MWKEFIEIFQKLLTTIIPHRPSISRFFFFLVALLVLFVKKKKRFQCSFVVLCCLYTPQIISPNSCLHALFVSFVHASVFFLLSRFKVFFLSLVCYWKFFDRSRKILSAIFLILPPFDFLFFIFFNHIQFQYIFLIPMDIYLCVVLFSKILAWVRWKEHNNINRY